MEYFVLLHGASPLSRQEGEGGATDFNRVMGWSQLKHMPWPTLNRLDLNVAENNYPIGHPHPDPPPSEGEGIDGNQFSLFAGDAPS